MWWQPESAAGGGGEAAAAPSGPAGACGAGGMDIGLLGIIVSGLLVSHHSTAAKEAKRNTTKCLVRYGKAKLCAPLGDSGGKSSS